LLRSEASIRNQSDFKFYPKAVQDFYIGYLKKTKINDVQMAQRTKWLDIRNKIIKAIHHAGGKIMAGSDTPEFLWLYGFSLHRELEALGAAGLSNYAVLETATKNPALFFNTFDKVGTIEEGKQADLVLLEENPIEDISNTGKRVGVMLKGTYFPQSEMNKWLEEIPLRIVNSYQGKE
jgi:imidazolonepropionase-like amidohydrolase